jgi:glycosyltransferase involved in cell wall biosynthesis
MSQNLLVNLAFLMAQPTGTSTYALNLLTHLHSLDPTLLTATAFDQYACYAIPPNLTSEQGIKGHWNRMVWTQVQLPRIYRTLKSSLIFSPIPEAPLWTTTRFVVTLHDLIPLRFPKRLSSLTLYARHYIPRVLNQAEHILCNSLATARDIRHFYGISQRKITPIPLAYDAKNFRVLDLPTRHYFLYLGRIDPYKNVQTAIAAFAQLPNRSDYEFWLVGPADPRYRPDLQRQIDQLGLRDQVKFLNYVPYQELPVILNQAIALVFPTLWEGFGLPVLEAMACGTPVITSNLASLPEVAGDAALLIDPLNAAAIADAMQSLVRDSGLRSQLRQAGLTRARQFDWATTGQQTMAVLKQYL